MPLLSRRQSAFAGVKTVSAMLVHVLCTMPNLLTQAGTGLALRELQHWAGLEVSMPAQSAFPNCTQWKGQGRTRQGRLGEAILEVSSCAGSGSQALAASHRRAHDAKQRQHLKHDSAELRCHVVQDQGHVHRQPVTDGHAPPSTLLLGSTLPPTSASPGVLQLLACTLISKGPQLHVLKGPQQLVFSYQVQCIVCA